MPTIGFDRRIPLDWMDVAAACARGEAPEVCVSRALWGSPRPLTKAGQNDLTVLRRIWLEVPPQCCFLQQAGLGHLEQLSGPDRLWIHWGMALARYSFFRDVAEAVGRILALQDDFSLAALRRRIIDRHGDRSAVRRALQRVVRTMLDWGVFQDGEARGSYRRTPALTQPSTEVGCWLVEALLVGSESRSLTVAGLSGQPALFPLHLRLRTGDLTRSRVLEVHREGLQHEVVELIPTAL